MKGFCSFLRWLMTVFALSSLGADSANLLVGCIPYRKNDSETRAIEWQKCSRHVGVLSVMSLNSSSAVLGFYLLVRALSDKTKTFTSFKCSNSASYCQPVTVAAK